MAEKESLAFIPSTICPEANSKVKCENENPLATEATRSESELSLTAFPLLFPNQTGHGGKESRTRVKVGNLPITGVICQRYAQITIIVIIVLGFADFEIGAKTHRTSSLKKRPTVASHGH